LFDLIKQNVNLIRHVEKYTELHQAGRLFQGLCPLHQDKSTPSFKVYPDDSFYCFGCLAKDELIRTKDGLKKIQDIKIGDFVYDKYGNLEKVIDTVIHPAEYPLYKIKLTRFSNSNLLTANHKMIVIKKEIIENLPFISKVKRKNGERELKFRSCAKTWIRTLKLKLKMSNMMLKDIKSGDYMVFPCNVRKKEISSIDTSVYIKDYAKGPKTPRIKFIPINEDVMYMFGIYIAEGNPYRGGIRFSLNSNENNIANKIKKGLMHVVSEKNIIIEKRKDRYTSMEVRCSKTDLEIIFSELFGRGCSNKKFPYWFVHLEDNLKKSFLKGIFDGDGAKDRNTDNEFMQKNKLQVTSKELVDSLMHICFSLQMPFSYKKNPERLQDNKIIHKKTYSLYLLKNQTYDFFYHYIDNQPYAFMRVEKNECIDEFPSVYDITVETTHTFAMDKFIVNNCHRGGTVIDFEAYRQNITPVDAVNYLCDEYNLHPTYADNFRYQQNLALRKKKEEWLDALIDSFNDRPDIYEYVYRSRGLTKETIKEFKLGAGSSTNVVVIPINDKFGKVVGFARRNLDPNAQDKYLNDASDNIYNKSEILYNFDKAKYHVKNTKSIVLNEGYFDVMSLWDSGVKQVVAFCGSRITKEQTRLLQDIVDEDTIIYLVPTNDETAQRELDKNIAQIKLSCPKNHLRALVIPLDCKDLNDILIKHGREKVSEIYNTSIPIELYLIERILQTETIIEMQYTKVRNLCSKIENRMILDDICKHLSEKWNKDLESIKMFLFNKQVTDDIDITKFKTMDMLMKEYDAYIETLKENRIEFGWTRTDKITRGMRIGDVITMIASSGVGKTTWAENLITNLVKNYSDLPIMFFSLEQTGVMAFERFVMMEGKLESQQVESWDNNPDIEIQKKLLEILKGLPQNYKNFVLVDEGGMDLNRLESYVIQSGALLFNKTVKVVVIDYMGYLQGEGKDLYHKVSEISKRLKELAKRLKCIVVILCQVSKTGKTGGDPLEGYQARDSGVVNESADILISAWRPELKEGITEDERKDWAGVYMTKICKNRYGNSGEKIEFHFDKKHMRLWEKVIDPTRISVDEKGKIK